MPKNRLSGDERRHQIIEKAAEVFAKKGVMGTRTRDIAEICNINEALIYRHFASKEELYQEAMVYSYDLAARSWMSGAKGHTNGLSALLAVFLAQFKMLSENPVLCANMWHGIASTTHDPIMAESVEEKLNSFHVFIKGLIEQGVKDGSIKPEIDPELCAWLMRGSTYNFMLRAILNLKASREVRDPDRYCEFIGDLLSTDSKPGPVES
ncbi:TetR/AcrR family transcriptional regulator [bacterium]|nr:TetR/AcrR family transcriptional regulator [bacterium]